MLIFRIKNLKSVLNFVALKLDKMRKELKLDLTPKQYQQLLETVFVGSVRLDEGRWSSMKEENEELLQLILQRASVFGKEHLVFSDELLGETLSITKDFEEELMPYFFDDVDMDIHLN